MPQAKINRIQRVQNKLLWKTFYTETKNFQDKNAGMDPNIKYLFHGTSAADPSLITENGFDMRFSK